MNNSNNKTSVLVSSQVPQFVRDDHETFVTFLEEYYKFLEQDGQLGYITKNFLSYLDIDNITEDIRRDALKGESYQLNEYDDYHIFLEKLYENFIKLIPQKVIADKTLILKHAKDFYRARGSEKSVRFLLRILFGKEVEFYYPKVDILRASDGKWYIERSIRVSDVSVNNVANQSAITNFVSKTITGNVTNTTAIVEYVDNYYDNGHLISELKISNYDRSFTNGEKVFTYYSENGETKFLSATLYSGFIASVSIRDGGIGYLPGSIIPVEGGGGSDAQIVISRVTEGSILSIGASYPGAGFVANDNIIFIAGGGSGASAKVATVDLSEKYHPNSYNIVASQILLEANTPIGNSVYSNLVPAIIDPANNWIANSMYYWSYSNCGPVISVTLLTSGNNYISTPTLDIQSNTIIRSMGILGRMEIIDGGLNYSVGDKIEFGNKTYSLGTGALANVTAVLANGKITEVKFEALPGYLPGGEGYRQDILPTANVVSNTGNGANIIVTALIGDGEKIESSKSTFGSILEVVIRSGGTGYTSVPTLNLANMAFGTGGNVVATIVSGIYTYPGRYLNDDGQLSSYNFLEDRDYYQNYSYVVKIDEPISKYRKSLKELTHPAGMKLFGQYDFVSNNELNVVVNTSSNLSNSKMLLSTYYVDTSDVTKSGSYNVKTLNAVYYPNIKSSSFNVVPSRAGSYNSRNSRISINLAQHGYRLGDFVYVNFDTNYANIVNGLYTVAVVSNSNYFGVNINNGNTSFISLPPNTSNLTISSGPGNTVSYINLSSWIANSNVGLTTGDSLNVEGNLVTIVASSANSNTIAVFPAVSGNIVNNTVIITKAPFAANGNVIVYNPAITISDTFRFQPTNANVYLKFNTNDTTYANGFYNVTFSNASSFKVLHRDIVNVSTMNGIVNVYSKTLIVTANNHELVEGETVYLTFTSGDLGNTTNAYYNVSSITTNTFIVYSSNTVMTNGDVSIKTANISIIIANHELTTNDVVYMWFTSDTANSTNISNGFYEVYVKDINTLYLTTSTSSNSNGSVTFYRNYMNVNINRVNHGFNINDNVRFMLETGNVSNIANGIYKVTNVANTNTYNIIHKNITISGDLSNLLPNNSGYVYISKA